MSVNLSALAGAGQQFFSDNGVILSGGKLYSYAAGTTTPQAAYTNASGSTPHTNPIILNSAGRVATGEIWLTAGENYKFSLFTSTDVLIATWDNITGLTSNAATVALTPSGYTTATNVQTGFDNLGSSAGTSKVGFIQTGTGAVSRTAQAKLRESVSVMDFGAVGDGITDDTAAIKACFAAVEYLLNTGGQTRSEDYRDDCEVVFPGRTYRITDTLIVPRAFANEAYITLRGDSYLGSILLWDGAVNKVMLDGANTIQAPTVPAGAPRLCIHDLTLTVKPGAGVPACGIALWASAQHPSHQNIHDIRISGCKVGIAMRQGVSFINASGTTIAANTYDYAPQDSIYRNIIIEACDYGVIAGHTHNKYEHFRITALLHSYVIKAASQGTFDNCYSGASTLAAFVSHVLIVGTGGAGAQNFLNCWFEGSYNNLPNPVIGDAVDYTVFYCSATTGTFATNIIIDSCTLADSEFMLRTDAGVSCELWITNGWAIEGYRGDGLNCNRLKLETASNANIYNATGIDANFVQYSPVGFAGTFVTYSVRQPIVSNLTHATTLAAPATSGTARGDFHRIYDNAGSRALDVGISSSYAWLQSRDTSNYAVNYTLALNPNGGVTTVGAQLRSVADGTENLGDPAFRWGTVYAAVGTINTSDSREKQQVRSLSDKEKRVAKILKDNLRLFKFNSSVNDKGENARTHMGIIAQSVAKAFSTEGLDASEYGMFCYDQWKSTEAVVDEAGNVIQQERQAGERYGVRYDEMLAFIIAAL